MFTESKVHERFYNEGKLNNHEVLKFNEYATKWWEEYKFIKKEFSKRGIKIYAEDENG